MCRLSMILLHDVSQSNLKYSLSNSGEWSKMKVIFSLMTLSILKRFS